ncbi:Glyco_hydro_17 domain-containing protein [Cephalotus follicularis]|uniref:glucan endo-1,3-beta-D-glucosidase n=1 Tax=Cephalotus follicularis TaxID=3775 RepID=A0A1Q3CGV9_CEPFO|nr:Glyco_hydro_17 domain-containing protein [Cephalotus follicularis]
MHFVRKWITLCSKKRVEEFERPKLFKNLLRGKSQRQHPQGKAKIKLHNANMQRKEFTTSSLFLYLSSLCLILKLSFSPLMTSFVIRFVMKIHIFILISLTFSDYGFLHGVTSLGISYGQVGNNLPPPEKVLGLLDSLKITKVRIYDTNPQILTAFANSNVELIVTVENQMLAVLMDPQQAYQWVNTHIKPYFPSTNITEIAVGNEVFTGDDTTLVGYLVPATVSIHDALVQLGLDKYVQVSTPHSLAVLEESYPPSAGSFKSEVAVVMSQYLQFLSSTKAPFWINAYPYFAYKDDPSGISLDYALFNPNAGMVDPYTKLRYDNMLYAQVDAAIFALARMGYGNIEVKVSETGWPSKGDPNEVGATLENAAMYNRNLLRRQLGSEGTPLRPSMGLDVYMFALFNEDLKPGPTSERNYGLYQPDGTMCYNVGLSALSSSTSTSSASISFTSSATKGAEREYQSLVFCMFLYLLTFQVFRRRPY